ncbi:hypothetical protein [Arcanobacterium canis]
MNIEHLRVPTSTPATSVLDTTNDIADLSRICAALADGFENADATIAGDAKKIMAAIILADRIDCPRLDVIAHYSAYLDRYLTETTPTPPPSTVQPHPTPKQHWGTQQ